MSAVYEFLSSDPAIGQGERVHCSKSAERKVSQYATMLSRNVEIGGLQRQQCEGGAVIREVLNGGEGSYPFKFEKT